MSDYYHEHSQEFINDTFNCDMSDQYRFFEQYLNGTGTILDIGFGSGRDSLYFLSKGYEVYAIDPEEEFVKHGRDIGIKHVYQLKVEDMEFVNMFDGIWACASLLHISSDKLTEVLQKCEKSLKKGGIAYISFKYGEFEGIRNGRYYLDMTLEKLAKYLFATKLTIVDVFISNDVRVDRTDMWINCILKEN